MAEVSDSSAAAVCHPRKGRPRGRSNRPKLQLTCHSCKRGFETRNPKQRYCCDACNRNRGTRRIERCCQQCGTIFRPCKPSQRQLSGESGWGLYCSTACSGAARRTRPVVEPKPWPVCSVCGAPASTRSAKTCSGSCAAERSRQNSRLGSVAKDTRDRTPRPCRCCGLVFAPEYGDKRRDFCSDACLRKVSGRVGKAARRARVRGTQIEPIDPIKVFERDGWRCQHCGKRTPPILRGSHKARAPELDHILPLAAGGSHTLDNVICSCRSCNQSKGAQPKGQMLLWPAAA